MLAFNPPRVLWYDGGELGHPTAGRSSGRGEKEMPDPEIAVEKEWYRGGSRWATWSPSKRPQATAARVARPAPGHGASALASTVREGKEKKKTRRGPWTV